MRPLSLTLEGVRSFRSPVSIDFTGRDHVAIIGDTGAGKSSLLESITWALYGRTSFSNQPNQELVNDTSTSARAVLRFQVRGQTWQVTRSLRRRGDGQVASAKVSLVRFDDGDEPLQQIEGVGPVRKHVEELLGLDDKAFLRTVVLPQGQFAQLLLNEGDTPRADILRQVWRLDELKGAAAAAARAEAQLAPLRARLAQALEAEPADPDAHLRQLEAAARELSGAEATAGAVAAATATALEQLEQAGQTTELTDRISEHLVYDAEADRRRAAAIAAAAQQVAAELEQVAAARADLAARLEAVASDDDGLSGVAVATSRSTLQRLPGLVERLAAATAAERAAREDAAAAASAAEAAARQADQAQADAQRLAAERAGIASAVTEATDALGSARRLLDAGRTQHAGARALAEQAAAARASAEALAAQLAPARQLVADSERRAEEAAAALAAAQREHAAAAAAHGLGAGDPCPVCERELPDGWHPPDAHALTAARAEVDAATAAARTAAGDLTRLETQHANAVAQAQQLDEQVAAAQQAVAQTRVALRRALSVDADLDRPDADLLGPLTAAVATAQEVVADFDAMARTVADAAAALGREAAAAAATAAAVERRVAEQEALVAQLRSETSDAVAALPAPLGVTFTADGVGAGVRLEGIEGALAHLDERQKVLAERDSLRAELRQRATALDARSADIETRRTQSVREPTDELCGALERFGGLLTRAATRMDATDVQVPSVVGIDPQLLTEAVEQVAALTDLLRRRAAAQRDAALALAQEARATVAEHAARLDLPPDADPAQVHAAAARRLADAGFAAKTARNEAAAFAGRVEPLRRALQARDDLEARAVAIADLAAALKDGAFPKWVTLRRSRALLAHASRLLGEMTAGRYAFADLDDANDDWRIVDNDTGMPRSPASLSGGEKFVASLSLAFGMVEMMARSGGRLESLWLDEGFGALDRSNLDAAVEALSTLASGGRLVVVISHLRAVAEQVPDVLAVTRATTGSTARWLTNAERVQVAEADAVAADETLAALSGLLE